MFECKKLVVISRARVAPNKLHALIFKYHSKRSLLFGEDFAIFCEGEWRQQIANDRNNNEHNNAVARQGSNLPTLVSYGIIGIGSRARTLIGEHFIAPKYSVVGFQLVVESILIAHSKRA
jgi:hypothetical protein